MKKLFLLSVCFCHCIFSFSQNLGINIDGSAPNTSAMLDVKSTNKGVLVPRMTLVQRDFISAPATGLLIYQTDEMPGFYYYTGSSWTRISSSTSNLWSINGNAGTDESIQFIGTTDQQSLVFKVNNNPAGKIHYSNKNTFFGYNSGTAGSIGGENTGFGWYSLSNVTTGRDNIGLGSGTLYSTQSGLSNIAIGSGTLYYTTNGNNNVAIGNSALQNTQSSSNIGIGDRALFNNIGGGNSIGIGDRALYNNVYGASNTGIGHNVLTNNTYGYNNTAIGSSAMLNNTGGSFNTAIGNNSLKENNTGNSITAIGYSASVGGDGLSNASAIGSNARVDCSNCLVLGSVSGENNATNSVSVGIGTTNPNISSIADLTSTSKGLLIPRMTQVQKSAISGPATGLLVYQTDDTPGFYYFNGSIWAPVSSSVNTNNLWSTNGNTGIDPSMNFIGTTDNQPLIFKVNNNKVGRLESNPNSNLFLGLAAGWNSNPGSFNVGIGESALWQNTSGERNTAIGGSALAYNVTGSSNTGTGVNALVNNNSGSGNTANGVQALLSNTSGNTNTGTGAYSLANNISGNVNTASGSQALFNNTTGDANTAFGVLSLLANTTGGYNTAIGYMADVSTGGLSNATAVGANSKVGCSNCLVLGSISEFNGTNNSRVGIGTSIPDNSAALELKSNNRGFLLPRMTQAERDAIASPSNGLQVYQVDNTPGFYYFNGSIWTPLSSTVNTNSLWSTSGNTGTDPSTNFIGTTDNQPLIFKINNRYAAKLDDQNIKIGTEDLLPFAVGTKNVAIGGSSMLNNINGYASTAVGFGSLKQGGNAYNTAVGYLALENNIESENTAIGMTAMKENISGVRNTATGISALRNNIDGFNNAASGSYALVSNTSGNDNSGFGPEALSLNVTGNQNSGLGINTLSKNISGSNNTAVGSYADVSTDGLNNATAIGSNARVDCSNCLVLGSVSGINNATNNVNVGIGTTSPSSSALLDLTSTSKGLLIPRMTIAQRNAVTTPSTGLMIYQVDNTPGFYYFNGLVWNSVAGNTNNLWSVNGNSGTSPLSNFIGTSDNQPLVFKVNNILAGKIGTTDRNMFLGYQVSANTTGRENTGIGSFSLNANTTGQFNTSIGASSLSFNNTGNFNSALGSGALNNNISGNSNTAVGNGSMSTNTTGDFNTASGVGSLINNTSGFKNAAYGQSSLSRNVIGNYNTAIGTESDVSMDGLSNATAIGYGATVNASDKVRIGNSAVTVIEGQVPFTTPSDGRYKFNIQEDVKGLDFILKLRPITYQFDTKRLDEAMNPSGLRNASYNPDTYKESSSIRRTGFIAQEVEKAAYEAGYNFSGVNMPKTEKDHYGLSYESFVVPLVKAVQEQQEQIKELKKENEELRNIKVELEALKKMVEQLSKSK